MLPNMEAFWEILRKKITSLAFWHLGGEELVAIIIGRSLSVLWNNAINGTLHGGIKKCDAEFHPVLTLLVIIILWNDGV